MAVGLIASLAVVAPAGAATWERADVPPSSGVPAQVRMVVDDDGLVTVAWEEEGPEGGRRLMAATRRPGGPFTPVQRIHVDSSVSGWELEGNGRGETWLAWTEHNAGSPRLFASRQGAGGHFGPPHDLGARVASFGMRVGPAGHVAIERFWGDGAELFLRDPGGELQVEPIAQGPQYPRRVMDMGFSADGDLLAVFGDRIGPHRWSGGWEYALLAARRSAAGRWGPVHRLTDRLTETRVELFLDRAGRGVLRHTQRRGTWEEHLVTDFWTTFVRSDGSPGATRAASELPSSGLGVTAGGSVFKLTELPGNELDVQLGRTATERFGPPARITAHGGLDFDVGPGGHAVLAEVGVGGRPVARRLTPAGAIGPPEELERRDEDESWLLRQVGVAPGGHAGVIVEVGHGRYALLASDWPAGMPVDDPPDPPGENPGADPGPGGGAPGEDAPAAVRRCGPDGTLVVRPRRRLAPTRAWTLPIGVRARGECHVELHLWLHAGDPDRRPFLGAPARRLAAGELWRPRILLGRRARALVRGFWARGRAPLVVGQISLPDVGGAVRPLRWRLVRPLETSRGRSRE